MGSRPMADLNVVEPGYFKTLGTALVNGRDFAGKDDLKSTPVAVVNRAFVRQFFPNQNPIGKHVRPGIGNGYGPGDPPMREIVGVVDDVKQSGPSSEAAAEVYTPLGQCPFDTMSMVLRTSNDPAGLVPAVRAQFASLDRNLPIYHVKTLDQYFADSLAAPRFSSFLLGSFAVLALLLAILGVYGVVSYAVAQRTHEIGIRIALGANSGHVVRSMLSRGLLLTGAGVGLGIAGALGLVHLLSSMLFGVRATDPITFASAPLVLFVVAMVASYVPARRAAKVNPTVALRSE